MFGEEINNWMGNMYMVCPTQDPHLRTLESRFAHIRWIYTSDSLSYDTENPRVGA